MHVSLACHYSILLVNCGCLTILLLQRRYEWENLDTGCSRLGTGPLRAGLEGTLSRNCTTWPWIGVTQLHRRNLLSRIWKPSWMSSNKITVHNNSNTLEHLLNKRAANDNIAVLSLYSSTNSSRSNSPTDICNHNPPPTALQFHTRSGGEQRYQRNCSIT